MTNIFPSIQKFSPNGIIRLVPGGYNYYFTHSVAEDFDGDGYIDVVASARVHAFLLFFKGNHDGTFQTPVRGSGDMSPGTKITDYLYEASLTSVDVNHDGKPDIIAVGTDQRDQTNIFTLINQSPWPTTTPLVTTSTSYTSTTTTTSSMFKLVETNSPTTHPTEAPSMTPTMSPTTTETSTTSRPTSETSSATPISFSDLLERLEKAENLIIHLNDTINNQNNMGVNDTDSENNTAASISPISLAIAGTAALIGIVAIIHTVCSQRVSDSAKITDIENGGTAESRVLHLNDAFEQPHYENPVLLLNQKEMGIAPHDDYASI